MKSEAEVLIQLEVIEELLDQSDDLMDNPCTIGMRIFYLGQKAALDRVLKKKKGGR